MKYPNITRIPVLVLSVMAIVISLAQAQYISSNTTLSISIKGVPNSEQGRIDGQYVVSDAGLVYLPLLKNGIKASGASSSKLARQIEAAYREAEIYSNPRITVISNKDEAAQRIDAQVVHVGGYVKRPGAVPFMRGMTLFQALSSAGGETAFGAINRLELHRNGKRREYDLKKNAAHMRVPVYPGDTINVPQKNAFGR